MRRLPKQLARDESGFQLIELLMVSAILPIVLSAILGVFDSVGAQAPKNVEYAHAVTEAQVGLQRMIYEVAEAKQVNTPTPTTLDFTVVIGGTAQHVQYACDLPYPGNDSLTRCLRLSVAAGGSLPALANGACPTSFSATQTCAVAIDRLKNGTAVFTYTNAANDPNQPPSYIEANVQVPASGTLRSGLNHTITLDNGTAIRNVSSTIL